MKQLIRNLKAFFIVVIVLCLALGGGLVYQQRQSQTVLMAVAGENRAALRERYAAAGSIVSRDGVRLAYSEGNKRLYAEDDILQRSAVHLVGDYTHHMTNTIETLYQPELLGTKRGFLEQLLLDVAGKGAKGSDIHLTVDAQLNRRAYELLDGLAGAAVVVNYRTGEVLAMCSTPATLMENVIQYENLPDTSLFNRVLNARYAPGSTFKIMSSAAWLSDPSFSSDFTVDCNGEPLIPNGARVAEGTAHGKVDLDSAFTVSCNVFFGELSRKIGQKRFQQFIDKSGYSGLTGVDRLALTKPVVNSSAAAGDEALLSWFGTGQPVGELKLTTNPLSIAMTTAAVANGGQLLAPHVVSYICNPLNNRSEEAKPEAVGRMFSPEIAGRIHELMLNAIRSERSIQTNARIEGLEIGGKSGTVQVSHTGMEDINALWTGFINNSNSPYAVAVVVENAEGTNSTAVRIGARLLEAAAHYVGA